MELVQSYMTRNPYYIRNVNRVDSRYTTFQTRGPLGLMLHSVGCAQPSAQVFIDAWNNYTYERACVHAFIDANTGVVYQTMPWNYRAPHCGSPGSNTHIGVEMCESKYIKYPAIGVNFTILDKAKAQADCARTYNAAVELFAMLCQKYNLDPMKDILSHREGALKGIATAHGDPEHYWSGLGMPYTMDTFRKAVKAKMDGSTELPPTPSVIDSTATDNGAIEVGMLVKLSKDATYYGGKVMPDWVKNLKWYVRSVSGSRAVINKSEDGKYAIMSAVNIKYLTDASPKPVTAGALVSLSADATYYTGKAMPSWVKATRWYVKSLSGDRAVIDKSEDGKLSIMSAVNKKYLTVVE